MKGKKIKICHIVNQITGRADGVFKHLIAQLTLLNKSEFEQIVICPYTVEIEQEFKNLNTRVYFIPELDTHHHLTVFINLNQILKKEDCHILCCHQLKPMMIGGFLSLFNKKRIIFFSHGIILNNEYNTLFEKIIYKIFLNLISRIKDVYLLSPSERSVQLFRKSFNSITNYEVYYDGEAVINNLEVSDYDSKIALNVFQNYTSKKILYAGRLEKEKAPFDAVYFFEELQKEIDDLSLHIFGDGSLEEDLKNYVEKKSLRQVYFYGYQSNINRIFNYFDVLLLTSRREGMPIVIWEALNAGLPFVASDVGGIKELLKFGLCGYVYHNHREAIDFLKILINNPDKRKEMGLKGQEILKHYFNKQNFIDFFTNFYLKILK